MKRCITILGSTGSIGTQALDIARRNHMKIHALAANKNVALLEQQAREFLPKYVCIFDESYYAEMKTRLRELPIEVVAGMEGLCAIAGDTNAELVLNAVVGMVGLLPTLTAVRAGIDVALANKETLVAGGALVMEEAKKHGVAIIPVDSEHSAIFQCLQGNRRDQVAGIILTASGGPFFGKSISELENVTPADALRHPNWNMGKKVTIDSSTLMNKGLEIVEAKWLFDLQPEQIEVVIHRQSIVHSAVVYQDSSVIAQMGVPDMRLPIQYAFTTPERWDSPVARLSLTDIGALTFEKPDLTAFPCLDIARKALKAGGTAPCMMNAANEIAVEAFLQEKIGYCDIARLVRGAPDALPVKDVKTYEDILAADELARQWAEAHLS